MVINATETKSRRVLKHDFHLVGERSVQPVTARTLALSLLVPLVACTVTREESIAGTYVLEAPCLTATLVVKRDHSFLQTVRTDSGETNRLTGVWSVDREGFVYFRPILDLKE